MRIFSFSLVTFSRPLLSIKVHQKPKVEVEPLKPCQLSNRDMSLDLPVRAQLVLDRLAP